MVRAMSHPKRVTAKDALLRMQEAADLLDVPAGGEYANALATARVDMLTFAAAVLTMSQKKGPLEKPGPSPRHLFVLRLTDEELSGLRAMMVASKTSLKEADFAQFIIREHLYRKGFHP